MIDRTCVTCGKKFRIYPGALKDRAAKFCSQRCNGLSRRTPPEKRFWHYVTVTGEDDCWHWLASCGNHGYGQLASRGHGPLAVHRFSYELHKGPIPKGMLVRHTCDNKWCVNPGHLVLGTYADNSRDAVVRQAINRGEKNGRGKLTEQQAAAILVDTRRGCVIAREYGISEQNICNIRKGRSWRHLPRPTI